MKRAFQVAGIVCLGALGAVSSNQKPPKPPPPPKNPPVAAKPANQPPPKNGGGGGVPGGAPKKANLATPDNPIDRLLRMTATQPEPSEKPAKDNQTSDRATRAGYGDIRTREGKSTGRFIR